MCQALIDIEKHALNQGIKQGIKQGEINLLCVLVSDGVLGFKDAAKRSGLSENGFRKKLVLFRHQPLEGALQKS